MKMRKQYPVDPMCLDLAKHMLSDIKYRTLALRGTDEQELAEQLQKQCEDFCLYLARDGKAI
jgi:hypothetical protein